MIYQHLWPTYPGWSISAHLPLEISAQLQAVNAGAPCAHWYSYLKSVAFLQELAMAIFQQAPTGVSNCPL